MSFKSLHLYSKMVLKPLFSTVLDLEILKDKCMHLMRSKAWEWGNLGFLATTTHVYYWWLWYSCSSLQGLFGDKGSLA